MMGHVEPAKSCKSLDVKKPYRVDTFEKINSNYADEQVLLATLFDISDLVQIRVYLPSRIQASRFSDDFIKGYNSCPTSDKMYLIYNGMCGRCIDVEFASVDNSA